MERRMFIGLGIAAAAQMAATGPAAAKTGAWRTLLDGRTLKGWSPIGDANWSIRDGAAVADHGSGMLVSNETFGDFELRAEFWVSPDANSGIFIRATNPLRVTTTDAYECNIYDTRPDPAYGTGAIVNVAKVSPMPKAGGRWNVMTIRAKGDQFWITMNGQQTVDGVHDGAHSHGRVALQYGVGTVKFRKVQVRDL